MSSTARASASREPGLRDDSSHRRDPQVLEHVEGRVERAMNAVRVIPHVAVPAAVVELRTEHRLAQQRKPRIVVNEVRAEPEPEAEMTEVDALQQKRLDARARGHEPAEQSLDRRAPRRMAFGNPERDEQQQRPGGGRPTSRRPLAVGALMREQARRPSRARPSRVAHVPIPRPARRAGPASPASGSQGRRREASRLPTLRSPSDGADCRYESPRLTASRTYLVAPTDR